MTSYVIQDISDSNFNVVGHFENRSYWQFLYNIGPWTKFYKMIKEFWEYELLF